MKNSYYESPKAGRLMKLFWKAAGADQYILERSTYSDQIKYFCLGGIVVATGVMAGLAGGYAIYTIFEPKGGALDGMLENGKKIKETIHFPTLMIAIAFGIVWGLIIYNIDRFIVTSTGKGDGTEEITRQEIKSAIPRIIMGMIIALTISKPIEIRMFKSEIDERLSQKQQELFVKRKETIDNIFKERKIELEKKIKEQNDLKTTAFTAYRESIKKFNEEMDGGAGARGYGNEAKLKQIQVKTDSLEYKTTSIKADTLINQLNKRLSLLDKELTNEYEIAKKQVNALDGLLERLKLGHEVAGFWISLFITLLFMVIELTPIFFKMMLTKGPYDYMDDNIRDLAKAEAGIEIEYDFYKDKEGMEKHRVTNHGAELKRKERLALIKVQEELNDKIIQAWKKQKEKDIEENPGKYIIED